jgi:NitT/TauT family transport system substrate-binding protein
LALKLEAGQGGAAIIPSVVSGQFQFGFSNVVSLMLANDRGLDLQIVAPGNSSTGQQGHDFSAVVAPKDSPIKGPKGLVGKTVAVNTLQNIGDISIRASVAKAGGDPSKIKLVELAFPDVPAALAQHRVDAAWVVEPFLAITRKQGAKVVSWNLVDTAPHLMIAGYFAKQSYIKSHPKIVKEFTAAMIESLAYANKHRDEVRAIVPTYTRVSKPLAAEMILPDWRTEPNRRSTETLAGLMVKYGLTHKKPEVSKLLP